MTKILEEIWVNGVAVTSNSFVFTLKGQIETMLDKIMLVNPTFNLTLDTSTDWSDFASASTEMFIYNKDWNCKEILNDMFSVLKMEVRVLDIYYLSGLTTITISYDDPNNKNDNLSVTDSTFVSNAISYSNNIDFVNDVGGIKSLAESSVSSSSIETPFLPLRDPSSGLYNTAEQVLITEQAIYSLESLTCLALAGIYAYVYIEEISTWGWVFQSWSRFPLDLTDYVYEKEYFDVLNDTNGGVFTEPGYKYTSLYFSRTNKNILNWYNKYEQFGFDEYVLKNIESLIDDIFYTDGGVDKKMTFRIFPGTYNIAGITSNEYIPNFSLKYQTNGTSYFDELKNGISSMSLIKYGTRLVDNSAGNNVDISRYGKAIINKINRIGNREIILDYFHTSFSDVKNLGDYFGNFILTKIEAKKIMLV